MKKILTNTGSNVYLMIVKIVVTLVMTPILVENLGNHDYGIWEILAAVIGYMGLLDFGMKPTIVRFTSKYVAINAHTDLRELYSTAWVFMSLIGFFVFLIFILWSMFWPESLSQNDLNKSYSLILLIVGFQTFISFPGFVAEGFLEGFQEYSKKNNISVFYLVVTSVIVYVFINPENGLLLLASVSMIGLLVKYIHYALLLYKPEYGRLSPSISYASWRTFKRSARFGYKALVQGLAYTIDSGTDTLVIGYFLSASIVPFYSIPANLINYIKQIGLTITQAFMPLFASMHTQNMTIELQRTYIGASRYVVAFLLPACVGTTLLGSPFIGMWVGEQYREDADLIILLLAIYVGFPLLNPFSVRYLIAIGAHGLLAKLSTINALLNIVLSIILVNYWGIIGVALGSVIPVFIFVPLVLKSCCQHLEISMKTYIKSSILPFILPTVLMGVAVYLLRIKLNIDNYFEMLITIVIGAMIYLVLLYLYVMTPDETSWFKSNALKAFQVKRNKT